MVKVYFENQNGSYSELVAKFDNEEIYLACLPALEKLAEKNGFEQVTESIEEDEVQQAKETLKSNGYFIDNLWTVTDVQENYKCTEDEAQEVLNGALQNDATMEQIWFAIHHHAQENGLNKIED